MVCYKHKCSALNSFCGRKLHYTHQSFKDACAVEIANASTASGAKRSAVHYKWSRLSEMGSLNICKTSCNNFYKPLQPQLQPLQNSVCLYYNGDANGDGQVNISDVVTIAVIYPTLKNSHFCSGSDKLRCSGYQWCKRSGRCCSSAVHSWKYLVLHADNLNFDTW